MMTKLVYWHPNVVDGSGLTLLLDTSFWTWNFNFKHISPLIKNLTEIKILIIEAKKAYGQREKKWKGLDMIVYMSDRKENFHFSIPFNNSFIFSGW